MGGLASKKGHPRDDEIIDFVEVAAPNAAMLVWFK